LASFFYIQQDTLGNKYWRQNKTKYIVDRASGWVIVF